MSLIEDFDGEINQTTAEIEERAKLDDRVEVLTQIRGVGRYTAMLIIVEVGDVTRIPDRLPCLRLGWADPDRPQLRRIAEHRGREDRQSRDRPVGSSPCPTTACATERSVAWPAAAARA